MIVNCPNCKGKLDRPMDLDYSIDVIQCKKCLKLWDMRFGEPEPYIREVHIPDTRHFSPSCYFPPVGETSEESETVEQLVQPEWTRRQWDAVTQLKGQVLHYQKKVLTLLESKGKKKDVI